MGLAGPPCRGDAWGTACAQQGGVTSDAHECLANARADGTSPGRPSCIRPFIRWRRGLSGTKIGRKMAWLAVDALCPPLTPRRCLQTAAYVLPHLSLDPGGCEVRLGGLAPCLQAGKTAPRWWGNSTHGSTPRAPAHGRTHPHAWPRWLSTWDCRRWPASTSSSGAASPRSASG